VGQLPLEGENSTNKLDTSQTAPDKTTTIEEVVVPAVEAEVLKVPDHLEEEFEDVPPAEGWGKRIWKESAYTRRLRDGEGVTTGLPSTTLLPKGLPQVQEEKKTGDLADDEELEVVEWDIIDVEEEFAMATAIEGAEGLNPSFDDVRNRADWLLWEEAIQVELKNLKDNGTWTMVERPPGANVVDSWWVLHVKKNAAGEVKKYKARLVAKGFTQIYGIDFYKTYTPIARLASFWLLLAIAARNNWPVDTFDFDSAYLNSILDDEDETIYLEQPLHYPTMDRNRYIWKLLKTLYGLKQGAKNWYDALCKVLIDLDFQRAEADHGIFFKQMGTDIIILAVHVDDCMLLGSSWRLIDEFKVQMNKTYKISDLGAIHWLLGIKVTWDLPNHTILLLQHAYIDSIILWYNFTDLKPSAIPMKPCAPLLKPQLPTKLADIAQMKNVPYREAVCSLMYAAMGTWPDIAFAMSTVAQFLDNLRWAHWEAVKRIFRYLRGTQKLELVYGKEGWKGMWMRIELHKSIGMRFWVSSFLLMVELFCGLQNSKN
jgi:Reverse transcriptase (RNA-dependent DNA polymerase)